MAGKAPQELAPIFILADDDPKASSQISIKLRDWTFIQVNEPRSVINYTRQFATTAVFLADGIQYPDGGAARLLQDLIDHTGKRVVILAEICDAEIIARWKRLGAADCIPHPTRSEARLEVLHKKIVDLVMERNSA